LAHVYRVEFQKRGLPHAHCLLICEKGTIRTAEDVDKYVKAEIPKKEEDPMLFNTVTSSMIHGPCKWCLKDGKCSKGFPKPFLENTIFRENGYPFYRRRNNGSQIFRNGKPLNNQHVIPYNTDLCRVFDAHINVEVCESIKAVKYIYKYIYKGPDCLSAKLIDENNEIKKYLDGRYITATEAAYRLLGFPLHYESCNVISLPVHLDGRQYILFDTEKPLEDQLENARETKLTAWFRLNTHSNSSKKLLYQEIPHHFRWDKRTKSWKQRKLEGSSAIGRLVNINPNVGELYYLRVLLTKIPGATSFEDLRTFEGKILTSYLDACFARGYLQDDQAATETFREISNCLTNPIQVFYTFADFVVHANLFGVGNFYESVHDVLLAHVEVLKINQTVPPNVHLFYIKKRLDDHCKNYKQYNVSNL